MSGGDRETARRYLFFLYYLFSILKEIIIIIIIREGKEKPLSLVGKKQEETSPKR